MMKIKTCTKCKINKNTSEFYKNKSAKDGLASWCKACSYECVRKWKKANSGKVSEQCKVYREKNRDKLAKYRERNRDNLAAKHREYYRNNKEKCAKRMREYQKKHPEVFRAAVRMYNARKLELQEVYTSNDESNTKELFNHKCYNCTATDKLEIDHHLALSKGHALSRTNAVLLCRSCNASKGNKTPLEFYGREMLEKLEHILGISNSHTENGSRHRIQVS